MFYSQTHNIINADRYMEILNKYKMPIAVFSGHYHATRIIQKDKNNKGQKISFKKKHIFKTEIFNSLSE